jgi:hypothetical protein
MAHPFAAGKDASVLFDDRRGADLKLNVVGGSAVQADDSAFFIEGRAVGVG